MRSIGYKLRKIGELVGERSVFRIGVDTKNNKIDLLSVDVCTSNEEAEERQATIPDYIG